MTNTAPDSANDRLRPLWALSYDVFDREMARRPDLVLDIGANDGGMSRTMASRSGVIHAFEPVPEMYALLVKVSQEECSNIVPFQLGVSDRVGVIEGLNVYQAWTLLPGDQGREDFSKGCDTSATFDMRTTTVDFHSQEHGDPDLIKLDVDGYEYKVLCGALKTLRRKPCPIFFEYSYMQERFFEGSARVMCEIIYALGYRAHSLDGKYIAETANQMLDHYPEHTSYDIMLIHQDWPR